jgi:hypothetical protein
MILFEGDASPGRRPVSWSRIALHVPFNLSWALSPGLPIASLWLPSHLTHCDWEAALDHVLVVACGVEEPGLLHPCGTSPSVPQMRLPFATIMGVEGV